MSSVPGLLPPPRDAQVQKQPDREDLLPLPSDPHPEQSEGQEAGGPRDVLERINSGKQRERSVSEHAVLFSGSQYHGSLLCCTR